MAYSKRSIMDINPADVQKLTKEYEKALSSGVNDDVYERIIVLEETQLDLLDCLLRASRCGRTINYLKNLTFRTLNILSVKNGESSYIPSVRTPQSCSSPLTRLLNAQLDVFLLLDKLDAPFADRAELLSLENRKTALIASLR